MSSRAGFGTVVSSLTPGGASSSASRADVIGRTSHIAQATYPMGSELGEPDEKPVHEVHLSAFDLDLTEVTVAKYARCVQSGVCEPAPIVRDSSGAQEDPVFEDQCNDDRPDRQEHPENCVDWNMAETYCRWARKRLPTEEEWEYAACGGGCDENHARRYGMTFMLVTGRWPFMTSVADGSPGPFGLYDMTNNGWQWTASSYCRYDEPGCGDSRRVVRGGSWSPVTYFRGRLTDRSPTYPWTRNPNLGFRCARSASP